MHASKPRRLLILDDEPAVAQTVAFSARRHGFMVQASVSSDDFFRDVESFAPSHIIIDLRMPDMDGVEVLRNLSETGCRAIVIMMSGMGAKVLESAQRVGIERGLCIGGILPKPFKPDELRALLDLDAPQRPVRQAAVRIDHEITLAEIETALCSRQFTPHFQPKVDLASGRPAGVEMLVRWQHPEHGLLAPNRFLDLVEHSGMMGKLTDYMIEAGLDWLSGAVPGGALELAINISGSTLTDVTFVDLLYGQCIFRDLDPARIVLELTETTVTRHKAETLDILTRLRLKGFQLSIDDFGTGYSSLVQLARLPFSEIKIDQSFVGEMLGSEEARKIVAAMVGLGKELHLTTVAEGVETEEQARLLRQLDCDQVQGYFFARPMDGATACAWLREHC